MTGKKHHEKLTKTDIGQTTEFEMSNMMHNQQQSLYRDSLSLSEATSICSSSDLADIPPAAGAYRRMGSNNSAVATYCTSLHTVR